MNANLRKVNIKENGHKIKLPDDDFARLMYYLDCVFTVLKYNGFSRYTNFRNYKEISTSFEDSCKVLELARIFNPTIMINAGVFVIRENIGESDNRFFEITDERMNFHAIREIVIGGMNIRVLKIMFMKSKWLIRNYYIPLKNINEVEIKSCSDSDFDSDDDNDSVKTNSCFIF